MSYVIFSSSLDATTTYVFSSQAIFHCSLFDAILLMSSFEDFTNIPVGYFDFGWYFQSWCIILLIWNFLRRKIHLCEAISVCMQSRTSTVEILVCVIYKTSVIIMWSLSSNLISELLGLLCWGIGRKSEKMAKIGQGWISTILYWED